ncbi:MAG: hypothetical protein NT069_23475 [Planctomycetota bacterium]|nr:hypothetical protein [Planctomycetota bacterium]
MPSPPTRRGPHLPVRRGRRLAFLAIYLVFCWALFLVGTRVYWYVAANVPLTRNPSVWDEYYPRIRMVGLADSRVARTDDRFDVLLLGGSVLESTWGTIEADLAERLERLIPGRFRIFNLAQQAFTSRDSVVQYEHLDRNQFDLVIVYDGINDVRMNLSPPELFRDDYSHCQRYSSFERHREHGVPSLPEVALDRAKSAYDSLQLGTVDPKLLDYAAEPQSPRTLRANLERIADLAKERGDPLLLLTYAWHIPAEYTLDKFSSGELDYSQDFRSRCAVELWGRPEHVVRALELQNQEIRNLAGNRAGARFIDLHNLLSAAGENFVDPCHLTEVGCGRFVDGIWPEVERAVRNSPVGTSR